MIEPARLLGFAFASADLLFEIDSAATIHFATGAAGTFSDETDLTGRSAAELFAANERDHFLSIVLRLKPGERFGPLAMTLAGGEQATLAMCFLPQNDRISCTLVRQGDRRIVPDHEMDAETGLSGRTAFLEAVAQNAGGSGAVALVHVPNLADVCAELSPDDAALLMSAIGESIKAMNAIAASRISETGFGVVTEDSQGAKALAGRIQAPVDERGVGPLRIEQAQLSLKSANLSPGQVILAMRYVVGCLADGRLKTVSGSAINEMFERMMADTVARAREFSRTVAASAFDLVFEPIVELKTGVTAYYEVLTRFRTGQDPAETFRFAEELGLANSFDLALILRVLGVLDADPAIIASVAINISARSIATPASSAMMTSVLATKRSLAKRVLIEITETAEISNLLEADKTIQMLRVMGYRVGIDDFGARAATLEYLHNLDLDFVKFDGTLIERLGQSRREETLMRSVLASCAALRVDTVAEWIDNPDKFRRCAEMGFRLGQGRYFGKALMELPKIGAVGVLKSQAAI